MACERESAFHFWQCARSTGRADELRPLTVWDHLQADVNLREIKYLSLLFITTRASGSNINLRNGILNPQHFNI